MKFVIAFAMVGVLLALGSAGFFMLKRNTDPAERDRRMARALAMRVALSIALFLFVLVAYRLGWIHPTGLPLR